MEPELSLPYPQEKNTAFFLETGEPSEYLVFFMFAPYISDS